MKKKEVHQKSVHVVVQPRAHFHVFAVVGRSNATSLFTVLDWQLFLLTFDQCALTIYGNLPVPDKINFVSDNYDGFRVEVARLPEALEQGLGLPESGRVGDAEDNEHTVALWPSLPTSLLILARAKRLLPTVSSFNAHLRLFWIHVKEDQLSFPILKHDADTRLRDGGPGGLIGVDIVGGEEVVDQGGLANPTATHHHHPAKKR